MSEPLPCPFCGGEPILAEHEPHTHHFAKFMPDYPGAWTIECAGCEVAMIADHGEQQALIGRWNRRTCQPVGKEVW